MAYADAQSRKLNPTSLTATIVINGAVFGALLMAAPEITKIPVDILDTYTVIERKPPEPAPDPPKPVPERATDAVARVDQVVKTPPLPDRPVVELSDKPVVTFDPSPGTGTAVIGEPVAPPAPVLTEAVIDPRYRRIFQPDYPASKIRLEEEGRVTVRVLVSAGGRVLQVQPIGNPDTAFFAATRKQALGKWRFTPATRDGVAIETWREISVRFELNS